MAKKRKIKIKYKNILKLLIFIILFIVLVKYGMYYSFNNKIYNDIKEDKLTIKTNSKNISLSDKNLDYIKKSSVIVTIKNKNYEYVIKNDYLKKKTNLYLELENTNINKKSFDYSKAFIVNLKNKVEHDKDMKVRLPGYLSNKKQIDIYGIKNKKYFKLSSKFTKKGFITFKVNENYNKYALTYVPLKEIKTHNIVMLKGETKKLKIELLPKNVTIEKNTITGINKKYISLKELDVTALKEGKTSINVNANDMKKEIKIVIKTNKQKVVKKDGIYYVDDIMIVNKSYPIKKDYNPKGLLDVTKNAYEDMKKAAAKDGINLWIVSGFRTYEDQEIIYNNYVKVNGKKNADTYSARPGYSEHQTGYVMDVNEASSKFEGTKEAIWLQNNSYKYGFIIRYPKGKDEYTGYKYEPWHLRYIGKEKAKEITDSGLSLEEYYEIPSKYKD